MRKIAYIANITDIRPIPKADAIEVVKVGGWSVVVKKADAYQMGEPVVYIELDAFLPPGQAAWQFLIEKHPKEVDGVVGHVLRTVKLRGQYSQGFVVRASEVGLPSGLATGTDVTAMLGITKYEAPLSDDLVGVARGPYPVWIPKTDQERIQNLSLELPYWQEEGHLWEVTEKLEGQSSTFAIIDGELHVCSRKIDYLDSEDNTLWAIARRYDLSRRMAELVDRNLAFQGEFVGPGSEGNIYQLKEHNFYVYDVYDLKAGAYLGAEERYALCKFLGLPHVPVVHTAWKLDGSATMDAILEMAVGPSALRQAQTREGLVFKRLDGQVSFKAISNVYLS